MILRVLAHEQAPMLAQEQDQELVMQQLMEEIASPTFTVTDKIRPWLREAGFVNLWFFLKFICGYSGPYNVLNDGLHLNMCDWRQEQMGPGARSAGFMPRSSYKSTTWSHGSVTWEILRDPNIRIAIFSCIYQRALDFFKVVRNNFDSNEMISWLYPEFVTETRKSGSWNDKMLIIPNRTRHFPEPTLMPAAAGGSTQGIHVDLAVFDDLVGDAQLNSDRTSSLEMIKIKNWFNSSLRTLLISWKQSRVTLAATRYAMDDPYDGIMASAFKHSGNWGDLESRYSVCEDGEWDVYYRQAIENGESIFPEQYSIEGLERIKKEDPWTYYTQYLNNPTEALQADFQGYMPHKFELEWEDNRGWLLVPIMENSDEIVLRECDVVMAIDPAASKKRVSKQTSKSALIVYARDKLDRRFVVQAYADYCSPTSFFDVVFNMWKKFDGYIRTTVIECAGPFKVLESFYQAEEARRKMYLNLRFTPSLGDKLPTIRGLLQPVMDKGLLWLEMRTGALVEKEMKYFPSSQLDVLDAAKIAEKFSVRPYGYDRDDEEAMETAGTWNKRPTSRGGVY